MNRRDVASWAVLLALVLALEIREVREGVDGVPLSRIIRRVFRTDTAAGRLLFRLAVQRAAAWLVSHILDGDVAAQPHAPARRSSWRTA